MMQADHAVPPSASIAAKGEHPSENVQIVRILPTRIWIENGAFGERVVMVQHEDCEAFQYAQFYYDYRYTDNATTHRQAVRLAVSLGATEPVEELHRDYPIIPLPVQTPEAPDGHVPMNYSSEIEDR